MFDKWNVKSFDKMAPSEARGVFLDIFKAFEKIWDKKLSMNPNRKIPGILQLIENYLTCRN